MTKFDKWWNEEMDYAASRHDTDEYAESELKVRERRAAKRAWNVAVEEFEEALDIHDTKGDLRYTVKKLHTER